MIRLITFFTLVLVLNACGYKLVKESENITTSQPIITTQPVVTTKISENPTANNKVQKTCEIKVKSNTPAEKLEVTYNPIKKRSFLDRKNTANINSLLITQNIKDCHFVKLSTGQVLQVNVKGSFR